MSRTPAVFALLVIALPIAAQTKILVAKSRTSVSVAADCGTIAFPTACDERGRLYVKQLHQDLECPLFRLSSKGAVEAKFDTNGEVLNLYAPRPDGGVIMAHVGGKVLYIDNFAPDGTRETSVTLERPTPFFPKQLAVFRSGEILVSGSQYQFGYKAATAIYSSTGHLVKQLVLDGDVETERAIEGAGPLATSAQRQVTPAINRSVAIAGDDGLVYLMRATSPVVVYAISPAGEVVRKLVVKAPGDKGTPDFGIRVAKNKLTIQFSRSCDGSGETGLWCSSAYAVVDATTGQRIADYETNKETDGVMACYAPDPDRFFIYSGPHVFDFVEAEPK